MEEFFVTLLSTGNLPNIAIGAGLLYLATEVRWLRKAVEDKVFPKLDDHAARLAELEGRYGMWEVMRTRGD